MPSELGRSSIPEGQALGNSRGRAVAQGHLFTSLSLPKHIVKKKSGDLLAISDPAQAGAGR